MRKLKALILAVVILGAGVLPAPAQSPITPVVVNTNAADFTVIAGAAGQSLHVTYIHAQNVGATNRVTVLLCDGTCTTAANVKFTFDLSVASATAQGGLVQIFGATGDWTLTSGRSLIAQVDTGATNNVKVSAVSFLR